VSSTITEQLEELCVPPAHDVETPPFVEPPSTSVRLTAAVMALWCAGFAAISVWFEVTDHFGTGRYADDAAGLSVANWIVTALKLLGVVVATLSVARRPRVLAPRSVGVMLWTAFATTGVYVLGSVVQALVMVAGLAGDPDEVDAAAVTYVVLFGLAAAGFGVLAFSYARRARLGKREMLLGAVGAPVVLAGVLVVLPTILAAAGLLPSA
jgi:hypothetical protein